MIRLDKFLADCNVGTRSEVKKLIKSGFISVNGSIVNDIGFKTDEKCDIIKFNGKIVQYQKYIYIMLNKPSGVISATEDDTDKTVIDLLPQKYKNADIFPVGRLDKDTVGLLLLCNDGAFAHNTLSPKKHIDKTYIVGFDGVLPDNAEALFNEGIQLKDFKCKSAKLKILSPSRAEVVISEGKYHQVKRMFKALGCEVTYLERTAFGEISLDKNLKRGEFRELNEEEMKYISRFCGK